MTKKCLDEALMQAYLDGELPRESAHAAAAHLAQCDACAAALASAEQENSLFATAFAPDANVPVPTELLRARIGAAVAQLEAAPETTRGRSRGRDFNALFAALSGLFSFNPQRAAAFASVLAVVAVAFVFLAVRRQTDAPAGPARNEVATRTQDAPQPPPAPAPAQPVENAIGEVASRGGQPAPVVAKVSAPKPRAGKARVTTEPRRERGAASPEAAGAPKAEAVVPGEKNYREAIASLERAVKVGGDAVLSPSSRIEYERNIAVLDRAIDETRRVALSNPKDKDAVSFLMAAYQSKVELLTTVADQAQVAAIGR
jgi:anti-sigma factor RsiW